jgi:protein gp37
MTKSKIEWTDRVWNPVTGCTKVSPGCANCYAERMAKRLRGRCGYPVENPFSVTLHQDKLVQPAFWKPSKVFVCSMSDLFHEDVKTEWLIAIFKRINLYRSHTFQILTKRPERMLQFFNSTNQQFNNLPNVWLGVSAENQQTADERIPILLQIPAAVRFVSCEPLLGPIDLKLQTADCQLPTLNWVICGGESGPGARPMHPDWARSLRDQCQAAGVPFFFKQWGEWSQYFHDLNHKSSVMINPPKPNNILLGKCSDNTAVNMKRVGKKAAGRLLDGREYNEMPKVTKI